MWYHLKSIYRKFLAQCPYSFLNLIGLSLGLCISFLALLYAIEETGYDLCHNNHKNTYRLLYQDTDSRLESILSPSFVQAIGEQIPDIEYHASYIYTRFLKINDVVESDCFFATPEIIDVFTFQCINGSLSLFEDQENTVLISEELALKYFNQIDVAGERLKIDVGEEMEFTIGGVFKNLKKSSFNPKLLVRVKSLPNYSSIYDPLNFRVKTGQHYLVINQNSKIDSVCKKINTVRKSLTQLPGTFKLQPVARVHLHSDGIAGSTSGILKRIKIYAGIGLLILIISLVNYILLYTTMTKRRMKDFAIRRVNGLNNSGILKIFLLESFFIVIASCFLALLPLKLLIPYLNNFSNSNIVLNWHENAVFLLLILALIFTIVILISLYFYFYLRQHNINDVFNQAKSRIGHSIFLNNRAVTLQLLIVSFMLIISFGYYKQLDFIINSGKGFTTEDIFMLERRNWNPSPFLEELAGYPEIKNTSVGEILPLKGRSVVYTVKLESSDKSGYMELMQVDDHFIPLYEIKLLEGRNFSKERFLDKAGETIIINESAKKVLDLKDPIGKVTSQGTIIGIVEDFKFETFYKPLRPLFLRYPKAKNAANSNKYGGILIKYEKRNKEYVQRLIHQTLTKYDVNIATDRKNWSITNSNEKYVLFDPNYYFSLVNDIYQKDKTLQKVISLLSAVAIFITILGLIGMSLYNAEQKTKEIGIRKVNGAKVWEILIMLSKDFIKWVFIAFIIASPIAYFTITKWLENFAYKTTLSWWIFALAGALALGIALVTVSWQSWRAATRNPIESLRYE